MDYSPHSPLDEIVGELAELALSAERLEAREEA